MRWLVGTCLAVLVVTTPACATLKAHNPFLDPTTGMLRVDKILDWAEYGIDATCQFGMTPLTQDVCRFGRDAIAIARAKLAADPVGGLAAVRQTLIDAEMKLPEAIRPHLDAQFRWVFQLLGGLPGIPGVKA